jgi:hypothetical protein
MWIGLAIGCVVAGWGTFDFLSGNSTWEVLVFAVPMLLAALCAVLFQLSRRVDLESTGADVRGGHDPQRRSPLISRSTLLLVAFLVALITIVAITYAVLVG